MKSKSLLTCAAAFSFVSTASVEAATIIFRNDANQLGLLLDELVPADIGQPQATVNVPGISGLTITVVSISGTGGTPKLNALADSFGVDVSGVTGAADDTDQFDAAIGEAVSFSFNRAVEITSLDLRGFEDTEVFSFGGQTITFANLDNQTTDVFTFSSPLAIAANTPFNISATTGVIGIESLQLNVIPEPSTALLGALGALALLRRRR